MRASFPFIAFALLLAACNSENAKVTPSDPAAPNAGSVHTAAAPQIAIQENTKRAVHPLVFFSLISTDFENNPLRAEGLAFLSPKARIINPFTFRYDNADLPFDAHTFALTPQGVFYSRRAPGTQRVLAVFDPRTRQIQSTTAGALPDSPSCAWRNGHEIAYRNNDNGQSLHLYDFQTGKDSAIVPLHLSDGDLKSPNVVCPCWADADTLYFADTVDFSYAIYRARFDGNVWNTQLFARAKLDNEGLICPQVERAP